MTRQFQRMTRSAAMGNAGGPAVPLHMPPDDQYIEDWWVEAVNIATLAAGATVNSNIQVQADSAFKLVKLGMVADLAGVTFTESTAPVPLITLQITDTGSGRNLFSAPVALKALFGNGQLPHILPVPRLFLPRSNISLQFTNYAAAQTYSVRMAFEGTKVFKLNGSW
jgi:hypothetical protein